MSDSIGNVGSVGAVSTTSSVAPLRTNGLAEVQYYNLKAIGLNRTVSAGAGTSDVPVGASLMAYTGSPSSDAISGTTRSALSGPPEAVDGAPDNPPPRAHVLDTPDPVPAHDMDADPPNTAPQLIPLDPPPPQVQVAPPAPQVRVAPPAPQVRVAPPAPQVQAAPPVPPQTLQAPPVQAQTQPPLPPVASPSVASGTPFAPPPPSPAPAPALTTPTVTRVNGDDEDGDKKPWRNDTATAERDFGLNDRDDSPTDTWAPTAKRSKEFAALDHMKLTSPEDALAQWRAQQESARITPTSTQAASIPPSVQPPPPQAGPPQIRVLGEQPPRPVPQAPTLDGDPGNPWQAPPPTPGTAPINSVRPGGFSLPPDGSQLTPPPGSHGFTAPVQSTAAPVDLSVGTYVNPNVTGPQATLPPPTSRSAGPPPFVPTNPMPNMPYLNPPGPEGLYQARFQAMAAASLNPMTTNPMAQTGAAGFNPLLAGTNPLAAMAAMGGNPMTAMGSNRMGAYNPYNPYNPLTLSSGTNMGLLGDDPDNDAEQSSYGMFGNMDGNGRRNNSGMGSSLLQTLGGTGGY